MRRALAVAAALALAAGLGRLSASGPAAAPAPAASSSSAPRHLVAGVDVSYPHSRAGAALAAAAYQQAFATPAVLAPGALRARVEAVATAAYAPTMLAANRPGASWLAAGPLGRGLGAGVPTAFFAVPVGRRLLSYSPRRARVLTWGFTLIGNAAGLAPTAYFGSARTELTWAGGRWRIAATRAADGPTPRLATPTRGADGTGLVNLTKELRPYGIAP